MLKEAIESMAILIVDDHEPNVVLLERLLEASGYAHLKGTSDPIEGLTLFARYRPDLVLLDLHMPRMDGYAFMEHLRSMVSAEEYLPILVLTADIAVEAKRAALSRGAKDFLTKPFESTEVLLRIANLLQTRFLHLQLRNQNRALEERVSERTRHLQEAQLETLERLARAAEFRDDATGRHTQRVGRVSALLARALDLPEEAQEMIRQAAPLHDVGKIGIPDEILLKPGRLTPEEFERMKDHTLIGGDILSRSRFPLMRMAEEIARTHHLRWDGAGYPESLAGDAIPMVGRIVTVADVFDALTHERPYKPAWTLDEAVSEIVGQSGRQFDPRVIVAFVHAAERDDIVDPDDVAEPDEGDEVALAAPGGPTA